VVVVEVVEIRWSGYVAVVAVVAKN
jgi:hypothetical protein